MKNTFRYALKMQDYVNYKQLFFKRSVIFSFIIPAIFFVSFSVFQALRDKKAENYALMIGIICAAVVTGIYIGYVYFYGIKKSVKKQINASDAYLGEIEMTVDANTIKIEKEPKYNEAGIIGIYPYSIMNAIYETTDYFIFIIGNEAKIMPKDAVPNEMKEAVFREIKKNPKCVFMK